jgi:hypothetical protein
MQFILIIAMKVDLTCWTCAFSTKYLTLEAADPFKVHPTSLPLTHEVFVHLQMLCMGIWLHTHTITIITGTNVPPYLGELADILGDVSMETMPLR